VDVRGVAEGVAVCGVGVAAAAAAGSGCFAFDATLSPLGSRFSAPVVQPAGTSVAARKISASPFGPLYQAGQFLSVMSFSFRFGVVQDQSIRNSEHETQIRRDHAALNTDAHDLEPLGQLGVGLVNLAGKHPMQRAGCGLERDQFAALGPLAKNAADERIAFDGLPGIGLVADDLNMWVGNRLPSVTDTITIDGVPVDLTGATVKFMMREESSPRKWSFSLWSIVGLVGTTSLVVTFNHRTSP
jgi:hypothetical protein